MRIKGAFRAIQLIIRKTSWFRTIWLNKELQSSYCKQSINILKFNWQSLPQKLQHRTVRPSKLSTRGAAVIYKSSRINMICKCTPTHLRPTSTCLLPCPIPMATTLSSKAMCNSPRCCIRFKKAIKPTNGVARTTLQRRRRSLNCKTFRLLTPTWSRIKDWLTFISQDLLWMGNPWPHIILKTVGFRKTTPRITVLIKPSLQRSKLKRKRSRTMHRLFLISIHKQCQLVRWPNPPPTWSETNQAHSKCQTVAKGCLQDWIQAMPLLNDHPAKSKQAHPSELTSTLPRYNKMRSMIPTSLKMTITLRFILMAWSRIMVNMKTRLPPMNKKTSIYNTIRCSNFQAITPNAVSITCQGTPSTQQRRDNSKKKIRLALSCTSSMDLSKSFETTNQTPSFRPPPLFLKMEIPTVSA